MKSAKAIQVLAFGGPEVLQFRDVFIPNVGEGQVNVIGYSFITIIWKNGPVFSHASLIKITQSSYNSLSIGCRLDILILWLSHLALEWLKYIMRGWGRPLESFVVCLAGTTKPPC